ncbi:MAG: YerC/YecD family TrpR-related protein [Candidatus Paceibacterota bacterium]|jgi:TrpR-related protein YerC/YecD|nr:YerC/YecD family TrpR-related protein [Candidatus Paceibacterota bacterium]MDD4830846.1 YerC/YecD family TrpR-related protein [Candidatus Paceibacterota bacterium]MDD4875079.1 YerC/YecD family TrpR-related protein [Candidatus Paceibacterota bacterium]
MDWKDSKNKKLVKAILALETPHEAKRFLRDLMTKGEIEEFGKRFKAAEMLWKKESYSNIKKETGFSSTTVARVSKWLSNGEGGYKIIINKLHHKSGQSRRGSA